MIRLFLTSFRALVLCASMLTACVRTPTQPGASQRPQQHTLTQQDRAEIFRQVWEIIDREYYDPNFRGLDWRAVGERYRPLAESARTDAEFYGVFELMLSELRDGHTVFIPPTGTCHRLDPLGKEVKNFRVGFVMANALDVLPNGHILLPQTWTNKVGDYDGDGRADPAVFRPSTAAWYVRNSSNGSDLIVTFGVSSDVPLPMPSAIRRFFY